MASTERDEKIYQELLKERAIVRVNALLERAEIHEVLVCLSFLERYVSNANEEKSGP